MNPCGCGRVVIGSIFDSSQCPDCWSYHHVKPYNLRHGGDGVVAEKVIRDRATSNAALGLDPIRNPCIHFGAERRRQECPTCPQDKSGHSKTKIKVFGCALLGECHLGDPKTLSSPQSCWSCGSYRQSNPTPVILVQKLSPGDVVVMTGVVRELHRQYPGRFHTDVRTTAGELWAHNPHVTRLNEGIVVPVTYDGGGTGGIHRSNQSGSHFAQAVADDLSVALGLTGGLRMDDPRGDIYLSDRERSEHPFDPAGPYWLVNAGVKSDVTVKAWPYYQEVVTALAGKVNFVQVGQLGTDSGLTHTHRPLDGVAANLLGETGHRDLIHLVAHCSGVLTGISYLMHLAAAFRKPCVTIGGAREPVAWNTFAYPGFHLLHTVGQLDCGSTGCWKCRTLPLLDGAEQDQPDKLCVYAEDGYPRCMRMIGADQVVELIAGGAHAMETH